MGSTRRALVFDSDKTKAKDIIKSSGLKTADFFLVTPTPYQTGKSSGLIPAERIIQMDLFLTTDMCKITFKTSKLAYRFTWNA